MKRFLCAWLRNWPIHRLVVRHPELSRQPIVLHTRDPRRGECVAACSSAAAAMGIRAGMPMADATSLAMNQSLVIQPLIIQPHDAEADVEALRSEAR